MHFDSTRIICDSASSLWESSAAVRPIAGQFAFVNGFAAFERRLTMHAANTRIVAYTVALRLVVIITCHGFSMSPLSSNGGDASVFPQTRGWHQQHCRSPGRLRGSVHVHRWRPHPSGVCTVPEAPSASCLHLASTVHST